jgi:fumarate reductase subunit C
MVIVRSIRQLWKKNRISRFFVVVTATAVFFPWFSAAGLVIALLFLPASKVQVAWGLPFYPSFAIPVTILALLLFTRNALNPADVAEKA